MMKLSSDKTFVVLGPFLLKVSGCNITAALIKNFDGFCNIESTGNSIGYVTVESV